jgi:SAM-dependent MidA family methyltransferase
VTGPRQVPGLRFDAWVERCLYHPEHGFYTSGEGAAGRRRGDFVTSPEVGPLFAEVVARAIDDTWERLGRPTELPVYDVGTGPGTLAAGIERAGGPAAGARRVVGIDRAGPAASSGGRPDQLPADLSGAVVVANELLDNLPFRVVDRAGDGSWREVHVERPGGAAGPVERLVPTGDPGLDVAPGQRAPWLEEAAAWVADVVARRPALLLVLDYGAATTRELADRGGWLRTYRRHQRGDDPLAEPGRWDITTDIAVDQLPPPDEVSDQATFLRSWGIDDMVEDGRRHWREAAARPDLTALRMRSRVGEAEALLDPDGLGSWLVLCWRRSPTTGGPVGKSAGKAETGPF